MLLPFPKTPLSRSEKSSFRSNTADQSIDLHSHIPEGEEGRVKTQTGRQAGRHATLNGKKELSLCRKQHYIITPKIPAYLWRRAGRPWQSSTLGPCNISIYALNDARTWFLFRVQHICTSTYMDEGGYLLGQSHVALGCNGIDSVLLHWAANRWILGKRKRKSYPEKTDIEDGQIGKHFKVLIAHFK